MKRALIIGGGIAGPTTAMALARAGIEATVYEAHGDSSQAGGWLTVAVNGLDALRAVGLADQVMAQGFPSLNIELASGTGKRLGVVPIGAALPDGTVTHTLKRADLYRTLHQEARRRGIRVEHHKRLVDAQVTAKGGVVAIFEDGSQAAGDVLIGADGIHSCVRRLIDPRAPSPRYSGLTNVGGFTTGARVDAPPGTYRMIFGKHAFFGFTVSPRGEIWWFANVPAGKELSPTQLAAMTSLRWQQQLMDLFRADASPAAEIIRATQTPLVGTNQHDLPRLPLWRRGPMVVIGDAAHAASPSSGQGASQAIEDSVELARCLRDLPEIPTALAHYETARRERVERVVAHGARMGRAKTVGPLGRLLRDLLLPSLIARQARTGPRSLAWLFQHHVEFEKPIALVAGNPGALPRMTA
jgi:2-polyprenyl-6-methoxyphenol hydroxylase-like FAD-dependent oxidoreductase